ncbi:MAG TPA: 2-phosphosulfolactate phosphatase [Bacteroidota bacterium]|nr:2-phosphosulfolactate phosphatase [Bacteroidota bacterium]
MRIDLCFTPAQTDELALRDKTVVVIDVLRASTTIITALERGAREIIPVATVESAVKISGNLFGDVILLGGERNGKMIEGFNLGNSPAEYTAERVRGKAIIFSSTNGSQALVRARYARDLLVCAFVNMGTVAEALSGGGRDFTIVCAGNNGMLSLEDSVCAGMLIARVSAALESAPELTDGALAARTLYRAFGRGILKMIRASDHGRHLEEIGFGDDLKTCAGVDTLFVLPQLDGNVIRLKPAHQGNEPAVQSQAT